MFSTSPLHAVQDLFSKNAGSFSCRHDRRTSKSSVTTWSLKIQSAAPKTSLRANLMGDGQVTPVRDGGTYHPSVWGSTYLGLGKVRSLADCTWGLLFTKWAWAANSLEFHLIKQPSTLSTNSSLKSPMFLSRLSLGQQSMEPVRPVRHPPHPWPLSSSRAGIRTQDQGHAAESCSH